MPKFELKGDLLAPPLTNRYGLVGAAFDYSVRFWLERKFRKKIESGAWVADWAYPNLLWTIEDAKAFHQKEKFSDTLLIPDHRNVLTYERDEISIEMLNLALEQYGNNSKRKLEKLGNAVIKRYEKSKKCYHAYLKNGRRTDDLIETCLFLARLDLFRRPGIVDWEILSPEDPKDIEDVKKLMDVWGETQFKIKHRAYLNPTFGKGSDLVGGADADIIADDILLDFKVTKHLKLEREHFNQIIGYYILSLIGGVNNEGNVHPIKRIGLYFARHGKFWIAPVSSIASNREMIYFKKWLQDYVLETNYI